MEERLTKFAQVVEAGSFTKAAARLHISQPALSMTIASLERELGASLLLRKTRPLQLTAAGQQAYMAAKDIAVANDNLVQRLAELSGGKLSATIGMTDSVAQGLLRTDGMLQEIEAQAHVSLVVNNSRFLHQAVIAGELDTAFTVVWDGLTSGNIETIPVGTEPLALVCHADQAAGMRRELGQGHLPRFISYDQQSASYQLIQKGLEHHGLTSTVKFYSTSPEIMLRLVLLQKGAAVLPYLSVASLIADGTLTLLPSPLSRRHPLIIDRPIAQIARRRKQLPDSLLRVTAHAQQLLQELNDTLLAHGNS
jgi:DNA-binding transcriptional LysR family regulator